MKKYGLALFLLLSLSLPTLLAYTPQALVHTNSESLSSYSTVEPKIDLYIYDNFNDMYTLAQLYSRLDTFGGADKPYVSMVIPPTQDLAMDYLLRDISRSYDNINIFTLTNNYDPAYYRGIFGIDPTKTDVDTIDSPWINNSRAVIFPVPTLELSTTEIATFSDTISLSVSSHSVALDAESWFYLTTGDGWIYYNNISLNDTGGYYGIKVYNPNPEPFTLYSNFTEYTYNGYTIPMIHYEELGDLDPPAMTVWPINYWGTWAVKKSLSSATMTISSLPGKVFSFEVPEGLYVLNITITLNDGDSFNAFVLDTHNFVRAYTQENITDSVTLTVTYPEAGTWKLIILTQAPPISVSGKVRLEYFSELDKLSAYLNGLVIAQRLRARAIPYNGSAIDLENVKELYVVDFSGSIPEEAYSSLPNNAKIHKITSQDSALEFLFGLGSFKGQNIILLDPLSNLWFPALIEGSYYGAPILLMNSSIAPAVVWSQRIFTWMKLAADNYHEHLELAPLPVYVETMGGAAYFEQKPSDSWMKSIYLTFKQNLNALFKWKAKLIVVANRYTIPPLMERALEGEIITGRIYRNDFDLNKQSSFAITLAYRSVLHDKLIKTNPAYQPKRLLVSFIVYTWDWSYSYWPIDNYGNNFVGYNEPEHLNKTTIDQGYEVAFHTELSAITQAVDSGALLWFYSGHGIGGSGFGLFTPDSLRAYEDGGDIDNPDVDSNGWVNPPYNQYVSYSEANSTFGGFKSAIVISLGCVSGAWEVPDVMLQHGASSFIASITLHWGVIGDRLFVTIIDGLTNGTTYGEALKYALILYSRIWSEPEPYISDPNWQGQDQWDNAPIVLYGDPNLRLLGESDSDGDGLLDPFEKALRLNPYKADSDDDGLSDTAEYLVYFTNPLNKDTDHDGMPDGWEIQYDLNPLINDANLDPDNDGLTNLQEYEHGTDPHKSDTDGDGYSDYEEVTSGTNPLDPEDHPSEETEGSSQGISNLLLTIGIIIAIIIIIGVLLYIKKIKT